MDWVVISFRRKKREEEVVGHVAPLAEEYQFKYQKLGSLIPTDETAGADTCWYQERLMGVGSAFGAGWRSSCISLTNKYEGSMVAAKVFVFLPVLKQVDLTPYRGRTAQFYAIPTHRDRPMSFFGPRGHCVPLDELGLAWPSNKGRNSISCSKKQDSQLRSGSGWRQLE